jgi:hypothetical protein
MHDLCLCITSQTRVSADTIVQLLALRGTTRYFYAPLFATCRHSFRREGQSFCPSVVASQLVVELNFDLPNQNMLLSSPLVIP